MKKAIAVAVTLFVGILVGKLVVDAQSSTAARTPSAPERAAAENAAGSVAPSPPARAPAPRRSPVLAALDVQYESPAEERAALHERLASSGASSEPWTGDATAAIDALAASLPHGQFGELVCYAHGCIAPLHSDDAALSHNAVSELNEAEALRPWGHLITGAEPRDGGGVQNFLILLRPDDPQDETNEIRTKG